MKRAYFYSLVAIALIGFVVWQTWDLWVDSSPRHEIVNGRIFDPETVVQKPYAPITEFPIGSIEAATELVADDDLVLGVVSNGEARGYPLSYLSGSWREIVNDRLGDVPIAATW